MDKREDMRVLTTVRKDILSGVIIENRTDLVSHPYGMALGTANISRLPPTPPVSIYHKYTPPISRLHLLG